MNIDLFSLAADARCRVDTACRDVRTHLCRATVADESVIIWSALCVAHLPDRCICYANLDGFSV